MIKKIPCTKLVFIKPMPWDSPMNKLETNFVFRLTTPLLMTSFGWDGNFTVQVLSGAMLLVGILAILIAVTFAVFKSVTK